MKTVRINSFGQTARVIEDNEDHLIVEAPLESLATELRPFALRVSPTLADKLFHRPGRIYIDKKALLLWMNSKDEFAEFQRRHTSKPRELIIEL